MAATLQRITERVASPFKGSKVNRQAGTIDDVLICGTESANGRDYPTAVFKRDFAKYENRPVNCDHGREATVERRFGWFSNVRPGPDGRPRGTLNCLKSHPMYERVMEAAERNPALFGFSHVAMCRTKPGAGGREVVEAIESVESIDLVAEPATTKGLFEQKGKAVKTTLAKRIESLLPKLTPEKAKPIRKWLVLAEDDAGMAPMMGAPVEAPDDDTGTDPDAAIDDAFKQAMHAQADALLDESHTLADFISKCRELFKSRAKIMGKAAPKEGESGGSEGGSEESKKPTLAALTKECTDKGYTPDLTDLAVLEVVPTVEGRGNLIEQLKAKSGVKTEGPTSAGRGRIAPPAPPANKQAVTESKPPATGKEFAAFIAEDRPLFQNAAHE